MANQKKRFERELKAPKLDGRRAWGVVISSLDPGPDGMISEADKSRIDTQNSFFRHETVRRMAEEYNSEHGAFDADHDYVAGRGRVAQSIVLGPGESVQGFPERSWIVAAIPTKEEAERIAAGEHKAFSMATMEERIPTTLTVRETGEKLNVEEVVNPYCHTISFVGRGANRQQFVMREERGGLWGKIRDAIHRVAGERGTDLMEDWPRRKFYGDMMNLEDQLHYTISDIVWGSELNSAAKVKAIKQAYSDASGIAVAMFQELDAATQGTTERSEPDKNGSNQGAQPEQTIPQEEDTMNAEERAELAKAVAAAVVEGIRAAKATEPAATEPKTEPAKTPAADPKDAEIAALRADVEKLKKATPAPANLGPAIDRTDPNWASKVKETRRSFIEVKGADGKMVRTEMTGCFLPIEQSDIK